MLRRFLIGSALICAAGGSAFAADLPNTKEPPVYAPPPPPAFTWTGLYIGAQVGYQWGNTTPNVFAPGPAYVATLPVSDNDGVTGGGHIGYNLQVSQFVFGLEGDVDGSSFNGGNGGGIVAYSTREPIEASIRGRAGFAWDRVLFYGTGGVAFGDFNDIYTSGLGTDNIWQTRVGWTAGGGVEYAINDNWSVRAEYRYTDFGSFGDPLAASLGGGDFARRLQTDNRVQVGFSYKFDMFNPPAPIVSKY